MSAAPYYRFVGARFPELAPLEDAVRAQHGDELYPFLYYVMQPLMLNVAMHGAKVRREQVFECVEEFLTAFPDVRNEIGVGVVEMAPDGWYECARDAAGPLLRERLDVWEPGWDQRTGPRGRASDPFEVEKTLRLAPPPPRTHADRDGNSEN